jgi:heme exporter protein B
VNWRDAFVLAQKESRSEWRQRSIFGALLLYSVLTVFLIYFSFRHVDPVLWSGLLWLALLFGSVDALSKGFLQEGRDRHFYYYTLIGPIEFLSAKLMYNIVLMLILGLFTLLLFVLFLGFPVVDIWAFICIMFGGMVCFTILFTFMSVLAARSGKSTTLVSILTLPIAIPLLAIIISATQKTMIVHSFSEYANDLLFLSALNILLLGLAVILFKYTWQD